MSNNWFQFKQFIIHQEHAAMKVGTDGVLLGAWASLPGPGNRVLDVGTGTGLIALMIAQRSKNAAVDALEIDPSSARQAKENFQHSPWKEKIRCIPSSFQDYSLQCKSRYDLIICNPPFFSRSSKTPSRQKNLARHDESLNLEDFLKCSVSLMKEKAVISLILPYQKEAVAMDLVMEHQLHCNRLTRVIPAPGKPTHRVLMEFSHTPGNPIEEVLTIETEKRHVYSDQFKSLVKEFYLNP
jgi:tRNA1Val (adenine37-N6)-methyltransferase